MNPDGGKSHGRRFGDISFVLKTRAEVAEWNAMVGEEDEEQEEELSVDAQEGDLAEAQEQESDVAGEEGESKDILYGPLAISF